MEIHNRRKLQHVLRFKYVNLFRGEYVDCIKLLLKKLIDYKILFIPFYLFLTPFQLAYLER